MHARSNKTYENAIGIFSWCKQFLMWLFSTSKLVYWYINTFTLNTYIKEIFLLISQIYIFFIVQAYCLNFIIYKNSYRTFIRQMPRKSQAAIKMARSIKSSLHSSSRLNVLFVAFNPEQAISYTRILEAFLMNVCI